MSHVWNNERNKRMCCPCISPPSPCDTAYLPTRPSMARSSNLETWIFITKVAATAGEMAPFPYIKGLCGCVVLILEAIEKAGKNDKDLQDLVESITKTMKMVQDTVREHGGGPAPHFSDVCTELEKYLTDILAELNSTRRKSRGIKHFLKTKKVSDAINGYRDRLGAIKGDFLIHTAIDSRFAISDIKDELRTSTEALTSAIETSQRHTTFNIDKRADGICEEIQTWGVLHSKKIDKLSVDVQTLKERRSYKGIVRDILPGDIYLRDLLFPSDWLCPDVPKDVAVFSDYSADIENSNTPKIVRVYRCRDPSNEQDAMNQFHIDIDRLMNVKHPNIAQIFGICRSPQFPAIILHGTTRDSIENHCRTLTAIQLLRFHIQLFHDLEVPHFPILCILILNGQISRPRITSVGFTTHLPWVGPSIWAMGTSVMCISANEAESCSQDSRLTII
ncbi:hypothetical protein ARMSODRAFT_789716 [Armillaria solidipes]|uniref:Protein kinase domain-containing protein n=1 Tax=Armillaria solidipes TaxID=1076256 RepID=A0A2H3BLR7_9AGAR|nr:hypothetical protein ARMSODRAFT_789716 [Armillaria solidipes]